MINLTQLLEIKEHEFKDYKVHFAIGRDHRKEPYHETMELFAKIKKQMRIYLVSN